MLQVFKSQLGQSMSSMRRFLEKPIKLNEGHFELGQSEASQREKMRAERRELVRRMRRDLYDLLNQHSSTRLLMKHLALVERTLQGKGLSGFEAMPVRIVAKALQEMETLVRDWSPAGLAELRSRMAVIVKNRPRDAEPAPDSSAPTTVAAISVHGDLAPLPADVSEVDHAEFEEMERSWVGVMPASREAQGQQPA